MDAKRTYTFDEYFLSLFEVPFILRRPPAFLIELRVKLSKACAFVISIHLLSLAITIFKYNFQGLDLELNELSQCLANFFGSIIVLYRCLTFILKNKLIHDLLTNLEAIFPHKYEDQKAYRLSIHGRDIVFKNRIIRLLVSMACISIALVPISRSIYNWITSDEDYQFLYPFVIWNPFRSSNFLGYILVYCFQITTIFLSSFLWLNEDVIIATSVAQLCMHYQYLGETLSKLDARKGKETNRELARLIRYQYNLDSICNDINEIYSFSNFVAFALARIYSCMFLISFINSNEFVKMPAFIFEISALTISVYMRCLIGMKLFNASSNLLYSIYDHNWYEGSPKYRKTILIMMIKANRPMSLQAFKLKTISMEYFKEIVVSTYEMFMFLYNVTQ